MTLTLKNSYTRSLEPFAPLDPAGRAVTLYTCGPTVYSHAHIGNFRSFLIADLLRRVLVRRGFQVRQVLNITDVGHLTEDHLADAQGEDKLSKAARELGQDPILIARHFEAAFIEDAKQLRLASFQGDDAGDPALHPRATEHIPEMLAMIQRLLDRDYAYCDAQGQVYFRVERFPEYGRLSGKDIDELDSGARIAVREEKLDPRDFALWKVDAKHLMKWDPHSPEGWPQAEWQRYRELVPRIDPRIRPGFPGWHIECSAMSNARLGPVIDIHTGGEDNIFPHHECEIAQSFGALQTTVPAPEGSADAGQTRPCFARYWIHGRHLLVDGAKMSKSKGTFFTARDLFDPERTGKPELAAKLREAGFAHGKIAPNVLRYALIANPYTQPMNFTFEALASARTSVERLQSRVDRLRELCAAQADASVSPEVRALLDAGESGFDAALDNNLNLPQALAEVFGVVTALNQREQSLSAADASAALATFDGFEAVLDVLSHKARAGLVPFATLDALAPMASDSEPSGLPAASEFDDAAIEAALAARHAAKRAKRFDRADALRRALSERGITIEDAPQGVRWKRC